MAREPKSAEQIPTPSDGEFGSRDNVVLIVDRGLIFFGKFALALLALFAFIAIAFFGFDLQQARSKLRDTTEQMTRDLHAAEEINTRAKELLAENQQKLDELQSRVDNFERRINLIGSHLTLTVVDKFGLILEKTAENPNTVRQFYKALLQISSDQNMMDVRPYILSRLAMFESKYDYQDANELLDEADKAATMLGNRTMQANILKSRGELEDRNGRYVAAIRAFEHALSALGEEQTSDQRSANLNLLRAEITELLAKSLGNDKQYQRALEIVEEARSLYGQDLRVENEAHLAILKANLLDDMGKDNEAFALYRRAEVIVEDLEDRSGFSPIYLRLGEMYQSRGEGQIAIAYVCRYARYFADRQKEVFRRSVRKWNLRQLTFDLECDEENTQPTVTFSKDSGTGARGSE